MQLPVLKRDYLARAIRAIRNAGVLCGICYKVKQQVMQSRRNGHCCEQVFHLALSDATALTILTPPPISRCQRGKFQDRPLPRMEQGIISVDPTIIV